MTWRSPFDFPEKDGEYLVYYEDGYAIGTFHRQDEDTGHWSPSWGLRGWQHLPVPPVALVKKKLCRFVYRFVCTKCGYRYEDDEPPTPNLCPNDGMVLIEKKNTETSEGG